jgi:hypothetical protein
MSEQTATVKVSVKPATRDKFNDIWAELMLQGERGLKLHEVLERAAEHYLREVRLKGRKQAA